MNTQSELEAIEYLENVILKISQLHIDERSLNQLIEKITFELDIIKRKIYSKIGQAVHNETKVKK